MDIITLCIAMYELYGQDGVIELVQMLEKTNRLTGVKWELCSPCEYDLSPIYEGSCLVCGSDK